MKKFTYSFIVTIAASLIMGSSAIGQIALSGGSVATSTTSATETDDGDDLVIAKPSGLAVGHIMIATITQSDDDGADGGELSNATRTGWIVIDGRQIGSAGSGNEWYGTVLYKIANAADVAATSFAFDIDPQADASSGGISAFSGVDVANPFDVAPLIINTLTAEDLLAPSITTVTNGAAIVMLGMVTDDRDFSDWSTTSPGALAELFDVEEDNGADQATGAAWALKPTAGPTGNGVGELSDGSVTHGSILIALRPAAFIPPNLWATSSDGTQVSSFTVSNGTYLSGPNNIFDPTIGGTVSSTAALGRSAQPSLVNGFFYWLPNNFSTNNGLIQVYGATAAGGSRTLIGSLDVNGGSDNDLGFVRLCMGPDGAGWILAAEGNTSLYLIRFKPNGVSLLSSGLPAEPLTVVDASVTLAGAGVSVSTFFNGDICMTGNGKLFALANNGTTTQVLTGTPNGPSTILTKSWDLVTSSNLPFNISVNGVAFDALGSLYVSTGDGLYYINQTLVNGPVGTVPCALVHSVTGLQDLASNVFPTQTTLPVSLISFTGNYRNQTTTLTWDVENMQNFSHFDIERSTDGANFASIGIKQTSGNITDRITYQHLDNLAAASGKVFYYRLKMVDNDGKFKYSNVILVRKEGKITGINISPNPVVSDDMLTVRFEANAKATIDFKLIDMSGRVVAKQQNTVAEGTNSVTIANLNRLQPGMYILQMNDGEAVQTAKLVIAK